MKNGGHKFNIKYQLDRVFLIFKIGFKTTSPTLLENVETCFLLGKREVCRVMAECQQVVHNGAK